MAKHKGLKKGSTVKFRTRRKKLVQFKITGRKPRTSAHMRAIGAAGKACRHKGKIGSKQNVSCIKAHLAK